MPGKGNGLRDAPYSGGSEMGVPFPGTDTPVDAPGKSAPVPPPVKGGPARNPEPTSETRARPKVTIPAGAHDAGGFILAAFLWGWVVLPYLKSGPSGVKDVLRAKFTNKGPGGKVL